MQFNCPSGGKRGLICLLLFTYNYVVSVWRGFLFLWVLGMGYVILLWHSLSLPYNYSGSIKHSNNDKFDAKLYLKKTKYNNDDIDKFKIHHANAAAFTGVYIIFLFLFQNIDFGYSLEPPH